MMACGGGGSSPLWRQMLADVFGIPVRTAVSSEGGALGAALLAAVGTGRYATVPEACDAAIHIKGEHPPVPENTAAYEPFYALYRELYPALRSSYAALGRL